MSLLSLPCRKVNLFLALGLSSPSCLLVSCSDFAMISTTTTGISASGDLSAVPDHVNIGYRRRELLWQKGKGKNDQSTLASIDSTTTWNKGYAIRQTSATGRASELLAGDTTADSNYNSDSEIDQRPLTFSSGTTVGLKASLPNGSDGKTGLVFGFKRAVVTRIRAGATDSKRLPSTVSNVTVHGSLGEPKKDIASTINEDHQLTTISDTDNTGGIRIRQFFGIGKAANKAILDNKTKIKENTKNLTDETN